MAVTVYVLKSRRNGRRYVGITSDLSRRLAQHARGETKAGQLLKDSYLLYSEQLADHRAARLQEQFLKSGQGRNWLDRMEAECGKGPSVP